LASPEKKPERTFGGGISELIKSLPKWV
jgi:hypothetical protein